MNTSDISADDVVACIAHITSLKSMRLRKLLPLVTCGYLWLPLGTFPYLSLPFATFHYLSLPFLTFCYLSLPFLTFPYISLPYLTGPYLALLGQPSSVSGEEIYGGESGSHTHAHVATKPAPILSHLFSLIGQHTPATLGCWPVSCSNIFKPNLLQKDVTESAPVLSLRSYFPFG